MLAAPSPSKARMWGSPSPGGSSSGAHLDRYASASSSIPRATTRRHMAFSVRRRYSCSSASRTLRWAQLSSCRHGD